MNITQLPIDILYLLLEWVDYYSYIEFIVAVGSYYLFVATQQANKRRFLGPVLSEDRGENRRIEYCLNIKGKKHGKCIGYKGNTIKRISHYREGFKEGYRVVYFSESLTIKRESWYYRGNLIGRDIYYDITGVITRSLEHKKGGRRSGNYMSRNELKNIITFGNYEGASKNGVSLRYSLKSGNLLRSTPYENSQKHETRFVYFDLPGKKVHKKTNYLYGGKNGKRVTYNENGKKIRVVHYSNGRKHGISITCFPNGKIHKYEEFAYGKHHGLQNVYIENGNMISAQKYKNGHFIRQY
jgi:antitoxin component YwqK of YwqJK toxin-antitoxin module